MDRGLFLLLAASAIWSTAPIFAKMAYAQGLSPTLLIESRPLLGFFFLLLLNGTALGDVKSNIQNLNLALKEEYISPKKAAGVFVTALGSMLILYSHPP
jgi:drug/metabolite transporter (DMT)-like permease